MRFAVPEASGAADTSPSLSPRPKTSPREGRPQVGPSADHLAPPAAEVAATATTRSSQLGGASGGLSAGGRPSAFAPRVRKSQRGTRAKRFEIKEDDPEDPFVAAALPEPAEPTLPPVPDAKALRPSVPAIVHVDAEEKPSSEAAAPADPSSPQSVQSVAEPADDPASPQSAVQSAADDPVSPQSVQSAAQSADPGSPQSVQSAARVTVQSMLRTALGGEPDPASPTSPTSPASPTAPASPTSDAPAAQDGLGMLRGWFADLSGGAPGGTVEREEFRARIKASASEVQAAFGELAAKDIGKAFKRLEADGKNSFTFEEFAAAAKRGSLLPGPKTSAQEPTATKSVDELAAKPADSAAKPVTEPKKPGNLAKAFQLFDAALSKRGKHFDLDGYSSRHSGTINQNGILVSYMPMK